MASFPDFLERLADNAREQITEHALKLIHNIHVMQQSGRMCDVTIQCSDGIITAHSIVLMSSCEAMQTLLQNCDILPMPCYPTYIVQMLVNYLYTGVMEKPSGEHAELFEKIISEYGLLKDEMFLLGPPTTSTFSDVKEGKPQNMDVTEKSVEKTETKDCKEPLGIKEEIHSDTENETDDSARNKSSAENSDHVQKGNMNEGFTVDQVKQECTSATTTDDIINTWIATCSKNQIKKLGLKKTRKRSKAPKVKEMLKGKKMKSDDGDQKRPSEVDSAQTCKVKKGRSIKPKQVLISFFCHTKILLKGIVLMVDHSHW